MAAGKQSRCMMGYSVLPFVETYTIRFYPLFLKFIHIFWKLHLERFLFSK
jgi:hypothetical protein